VSEDHIAGLVLCAVIIVLPLAACLLFGVVR
jgi:hypothetical protein